MKRHQKGFTLVELLVVIAIIAVLAAAVTVSMKSFAVKGRSAKALGEVSSAIPQMISCWGNEGDPNSPPASGNANNICSLDGSSSTPSYGKWPQATGDLSSYAYTSSLADRKNWYIRFTSNASNDDVRICCNSAMNKCKILSPANSTCNASTY